MPITSTAATSHRLAERLRRSWRARCCSTASRAGAIPRTPRTTRSSRSAWWCRSTDDDVRAAMAIAREEGVPLLPRGGGTSQSGPDRRPGAGHRLQQAPEQAGRARRGRRAPAWSSPASCSTSSTGSCRQPGLWFPGRRVDLQPRHHRRHGRQQLLRHALDPLRHHARQRARHRCDPGRRQRGPLRRGRAQPRAACANGLPSPWRGGVRGGGTHRATPTRSPQEAWRQGRPLVSLCPRPARPRPPRGGAHRARLPRGVAPRRRLSDRRAGARRPSRSISPRCCAARRARSPSRAASS